MEDEKDIVKYRNEFNLTNLNKLDKIEQDILFTMCSRITKNKTLEAEMTFAELQKKAFLSERKYSLDKSYQKLSSLGDKIVKIIFTVSNENRFIKMPMFSLFSADGDKENISVRLNSEFAHYLFDIPEKIGFSKFELEQFIFLKSKYAKTLFRFLLQNYKGKWIVGFNDFKAIMDFPKSYGNGRVLDYTKKLFPEIESTGYFSDIEIDVTTFNKQGRPIKDVIFSYKINKEKALEAQGQMRLDYEPVIETKEKMITKVVSDPKELPHIETTKSTIQEEKKCPKCGSKVIQRHVTDEKKESFGQLYEKCEKNDLSLGVNKCNYFAWIDK
jgi:plasmid replication initiation protein